METSDLFLQKAKDHYRFRLLGETQADRQPSVWLIVVLPPLLLSLVVIFLWQIPVQKTLLAEVSTATTSPHTTIVHLPAALLPGTRLRLSVAADKAVEPLQWQYCQNHQAHTCIQIQAAQPILPASKQLTLIATTRFIDDVFK